jgi:hypothetical protein
MYPIWRRRQPLCREIAEVQTAGNVTQYSLFFIFKMFITKKVCTACTRTSYKVVPLTKWNKYLHTDKGETEMHISVNNSSENI